MVSKSPIQVQEASQGEGDGRTECSKSGNYLLKKRNIKNLNISEEIKKYNIKAKYSNIHIKSIESQRKREEARIKLNSVVRLSLV